MFGPIALNFIFHLDAGENSLYITTMAKKKFLDFKKKLLEKLPQIKQCQACQKRAPLFLLVIIIGFLLYRYRGQLIVATVNGQPIFRTSLIKELEQQGGQKVLDSLIAKTLILQEGKKKNIVISQEEIDKEIEEIEKSLMQQGQDLAQVLVARGLSRRTLAEEIKIQKILEKATAKEVAVTEEEMKKFYEEEASSLAAGTSFEEMQESIKAQLEQEKKSEQIQVWLQSIHDQAKINYLLFQPPLKNS
jgi:hypothetical protein